MDLRRLDWDKALLQLFDIPEAILPKIVSSSEVYGVSKLPSIEDVPLAGISVTSKLHSLAKRASILGRQRTPAEQVAFFS